MHIVIVGAGEVGGFLAERLRTEGLDVVVIENNPGRGNELAANLDVQVVIGSGSDPTVLAEAGLDRAGLVAAVTQNDEVNLIVSLLAKQAGVETTVVRVESAELRGPSAAGLLSGVGADVVIDPDAETADEVLELIHSLGADEVYPMADGQLLVVGANLGEKSRFANRTLRDIGSSATDCLFGAVSRGDDTVIPGGDHVLRPGDHVRFLCRVEDQAKVLASLGVSSRRARKVMILGGGAVGARVAERLEYEGVAVTLIERDRQRATDLSVRLRRTVVIQGDVADTELLLRESVGEMDTVVATTGEDASNVLACSFASAEGAPYTVAMLHRLALLPLVRRLGIDAALSPRTASANAVLRAVRGGTRAVATFLESDIEVDEFEIAPGSRADGAQVANLGLPADFLIGAVIRPGQQAEIARGTTELAANDRLVIFGKPNAIAAVRPSFML